MDNDNNTKVVSDENKKKDRGVLGTGTPGTRLKGLHTKEGRGLTLKVFVQMQAKKGNADAKTWLENKQGKNKMKRSDASVARIQVEKNATKLAKKAKKAN